jgi:putative DNA primase/helicase
MTELFSAAEVFHELGIPVVPFKVFQKEDGEYDKKPLVKWKIWMKQPQTEQKFNGLPWNEANAFGVILGTQAKNGYYLSVIDYDVKGAVSEGVKAKGKEIFKDFPITQTHETVNKGLHLVYWSRNKTRTDGTFHDTVGLELLGEKKLCLVPPSFGYKCLNDNSPREIENLEKTFYSILKKHGFTHTEETEVEQQLDNFSFSLSKLVDLKQMNKLNANEYQGSHPFHDSTTEKNFCINTKTNAWHCFRHNSGGGALQFLAMKEGLIKCEQAKKGALRGKKFREVLQIAASQGLVDQKVIEQSEINPVILAKDLMEDYVFVVDQDTNELFYYNAKEGIYTNKTGQLIKREIVKRLDENFKTRYYNEINEFITGSAPLVEMNVLQPEIIAVKNWLLNIITRELKPLSPDVYLTNKLYIEYNPEIKYADSFNAKFLCQVVANKTQLKQIQELVGHCLYRKIVTETGLVCLGKGGNGKSIFLTVIKFFLGPQNVSSHTIQQLCYDKFTIAELKGKLANICADLPHKELMNTGTYKALVSGDSVPIKIKHVQGKGETLDPYTKYLYSANHLPPIQSEEDCYAWYRRFIFADFKKTFTPENSTPRQVLLAKLTTPKELSALLNWALDGFARLHKNGDVSNKPSVEAIRKEYRKRSSTTLAYFDDQVTITDSYDDWIFTDDWFRDYVTYCHNNEIKPKSKGEFLKDVEQYLPGVKKTKIRPGPKASPLSAWRYVKFVPCVPHVPTSENILAKNGKKQLLNFSVSEEKAGKCGTSGTGGTPKPEFCAEVCRNYHNKGEYGCTHPNPISLNEKTVRPLKCPGFKPFTEASQ